jgi:hypothetical protein
VVRFSLGGERFISSLKGPDKLWGPPGFHGF